MCVCVCERPTAQETRETTRARKDETARLQLNREYKLSFTTGTPARVPTRVPLTHPQEQNVTEEECLCRKHTGCPRSRDSELPTDHDLCAQIRDLEAAAEQGASAGSTRASHAAETTNPQALQRPTIFSPGKKSLFAVRQHFVLAKSRSLLLPRPPPFIGPDGAVRH